MWPLFIVFNHPPIGCLSDLLQIVEEVKIKQFIPVRPVKAFNISILIRFSGLNVMNHHACGFRPGNKIAAQELRSVVDPQNIGKTTLQTKALKDPYQPPAGYGGVNLYMDCLTVKIVHYIERPEPFAGIEHIAHEIGRPNLIRQRRHKQGLLKSLRQPLLGPAFLVQLQAAVNTIHPLVVPGMTLTPQGLKRFPETPPGMTIDHLMNGIDHLGIIVSVLR